VISGLLLHWLGICPIVKRIWTPGWTLFSGGICFFFLAAFSWIVDVKSYRRWAFPLVVVGMNSIAAYLLPHLWEDFLVRNLHIHFGYGVFRAFGVGLEPLITGIGVMLLYWLILVWMYRRRIFLRI
jgi:heparan-alpha-glucosaminide N-acetyltransferase